MRRLSRFDGLDERGSKEQNDGVMPQPKQQALDGGGRPRVVAVQVSKKRRNSD